MNLYRVAVWTPKNGWVVLPRQPYARSAEGYRSRAAAEVAVQMCQRLAPNHEYRIEELP